MIKPNSTFNVLYISDIQRTHDFYKLIGAEITQLEEDKVVVKLGEFELHFVLENTEPFEEYRFAAKKEGRGLGNLFYVGVDNIQEIYNSLKELGADLKSEVKDNHWDGKEFMVEDVDGYKIVFYSI